MRFSQTFYINPQGEDIYGWLFTVRFDPAGVPWLNGLFPIQVETQPNGQNGTARRFIDGRWQMVDLWGEQIPNVDNPASGDNSHDLQYEIAGAPFLWVKGEDDDHRVWWEHGQQFTEGERALDPIGYDGPDWEHIYFVSWARGTGDVIVYARYDTSDYFIFGGSPYPAYGAVNPGTPIEMSYIDLWADDEAPAAYQEPGYVTWDEGTESLYVCGRAGNSTDGQRAIIGRIVPGGLAPVGGDTPDEDTRFTTIIEYDGSPFGLDEDDEPIRYAAVSVRVLLDGRMVACLGGQQGTEPKIRYKTSGGADWLEFAVQPPHEGWEDHRVNYQDAHGAAIDDLWVVGQRWDAVNEAHAPLLCHWDGAAWTEHDVSFGHSWQANWIEPGDVISPGGEPIRSHREDDGLHGVTAAATDNVWIVGTRDSIREFVFDVQTFRNGVPFSAHWNGVSWTEHILEE